MKYIIGDVHGKLDLLKKLVSKLPKNIDYKDIVLVGDLVDRGEDSRGVINFVRDNNITVVLGNHEDMMIKSFEGYEKYNNPLWNSDWIYNGGNKTLNNYKNIIQDKNVLDYKALKKDVEFISSFPKYLHIKEELDSKGRELFISHAFFLDGIPNFLELEDKHLFDVVLIWNRNLPRKISDKYFNVSGHNIIEKIAFDNMNELKVPKKYIKDNIIIDEDKGYACIDSGAFLDKEFHPWSGKLTCLVYPTMEVIQT